MDIYIYTYVQYVYFVVMLHIFVSASCFSHYLVKKLRYVGDESGDDGIWLGSYEVTNQLWG